MSELSLAKLEIADRIYVDGRDIRGDRRFLPSELSVPRSQVDPSLLRSLTLDAEDRARPYLYFQASGWRGQLVVSTFLRFVVTGNELFMEVSHSLRRRYATTSKRWTGYSPSPLCGRQRELAGALSSASPCLCFARPSRSRSS